MLLLRDFRPLQSLGLWQITNGNPYSDGRRSP